LLPVIELFPRPVFYSTSPVRAPRPQKPLKILLKTSELGDQLRPDRDHPDKQHNRRQCRRFFYKSLQHARLLMCEHRGNIVLFLFFGQAGQFEKGTKRNPVVNSGDGVAGTRPERGTFGSLPLRYIDDRFSKLVRVSGAFGGYFA
jgi:hypothetical protein